MFVCSLFTSTRVFPRLVLMEKTDVLDRRVRLEDIYATLVNAVAKTRNESTQKDAALASAIDPRIETAKLIDESTVFAIIAEAEEAVKSEPNVLELDAPVTICGDVHGQFLDLIKLFRTAAGGGLLHDTPKTPSQTRRLPDRILRGLKAEPRNNSTFLFLGDHVDRGPDSFTCMIYLLALKGAFPERIFLL
ncbi:protein phosphatase 3 catalytic subunit alpha-like [Oscarella lobularis]|uniref:protein phosphatase 3 catalytic subunit alpha-like n=1 Tax=Oscarella lobularis TaxID=121494 RepID=UPI003313FA71